MTYTLWRCSRVSSDGDEACPGFKYLEPSQDPGRCDHKTLMGYSAQTMREHACAGRMFRVGDFEFNDAAVGQQEGVADAIHAG